MTLDRELAEIDLLISQARTEADRHEARRRPRPEKLAALPERADPSERLEPDDSLVALTKRAGADGDAGRGPRGQAPSPRPLPRRLADYYRRGGLEPASTPTTRRRRSTADADDADAAGRRSPGCVIGAQEDLRREIARAMHDGPAQSLTNIVLQAQIVERLVARDPDRCRGRGRASWSPWSSRRSTRPSRSSSTSGRWSSTTSGSCRRCGVPRASAAAGPASPVEFDSMGQDRRLPMDLESGLFRILDEALAAYLGGEPDRVALKLDWSDRLEAAVAVATDERSPQAERAPPRSAHAASEEAGQGPAARARCDDRGAARGQRGRGRGGRRAAIVALPAADVARDPGPCRVASACGRAARRRRRVSDLGGGAARRWPDGAEPAIVVTARARRGSGPRRVRADPRPDGRAHDACWLVVFGGTRRRRPDGHRRCDRSSDRRLTGAVPVHPSDVAVPSSQCHCRMRLHIVAQPSIWG